jgi:dTDP-4-dehydrorhamnose 3,5-epimerase
MKVLTTELAGVVILEPRRFSDDRGFFFESFNDEHFARAGLPTRFVQDNVSYSGPNVLRGLHYQLPAAQGKLVSVLQGEVFDVAVDIRRGSPTFGRWVGVTLSFENGRQVYIPEGFAHGFLVTGSCAVFHYKCTARYEPKAEGSIRWDDPTIGIAWPRKDVILSAKDAAAPLLSEVSADRLFSMDDPAGSPPAISVTVYRGGERRADVSTPRSAAS